jgi:hypothetical protein
VANALIDTIVSADPAVRNRSLSSLCAGASAAELVAWADELDAFWRGCDNLYQRVRAQFFLFAIHRFHLPACPDLGGAGRVPFSGYTYLLNRRFEEAIDVFRREQTRRGGPDAALCSALAEAYHSLGFQTLANQVRRSVRSTAGNQWMFRIGHPADQPLRIVPSLKRRDGSHEPFPVLFEQTPVRMDLSHTAWSDIFFLGMDYPEGARVLNVSIDLGVRGRDAAPEPPVRALLRVIDEPVLRLVSVDLGAHADITRLAEVFDFARDYLGLLKAAVIASGIVPPGMESSGQSLQELLGGLVGPGHGLELVSHVNNIPKGSRLAVSTNLLAALISVCMRATGQTASLEGPLTEGERRIVAARAILGEWLAGSGGGWQDSGGLWPGIKLITGVPAAEGDPEFGISRGRLLPAHRIFTGEEISEDVRNRLQECLVLVHGGMAQDVGPILEMVTEKYLLRLEAEWQGRAEAGAILDQILAALQEGDIRRLGQLTTRNFEGPIQTIIPWAGNRFTRTLIDRTRDAFGESFWGFWMLGGMSGGGMGFIFAPEAAPRARDFLAGMMLAAKREMEHALPFAMDPVVYDFAINNAGSTARLLRGTEALMPPAYYAGMVPVWARQPPDQVSRARRAELAAFGGALRGASAYAGMMPRLFEAMFPETAGTHAGDGDLQALLREYGFDRVEQEAIRAELQNGNLGLSQNRLPSRITIEDVKPGDVTDAAAGIDPVHVRRGEAALAAGEVAVVTLAAGTGSRWTQGAGVVKALHPFCLLAGRHRSFVEVHLAKSRRISRLAGNPLPHIITTSYLTHEPIRDSLALHRQHGYPGPLYLSPGQSIGIRMVPMVRDLRFQWEERAQQRLDEQAQKVRLSLQQALLGWARGSGEGTDYTDNLPLQCLHPVGHWYEIPNLMRNGVLTRLLQERPQLRCLLLHNIDTVGADVDPGLLGLHLDSNACLTFEVVPRLIDDLGGGLARVDGRTRLVEGLALPHEELEFRLSYYNSMTTWIDVDRLLAVFGLERGDLDDPARVAEAVRTLGRRLPTYITLKNVKKRWGQGQEDVYPVSQYEKLWSDMSALPEVDCRYVVVSRTRGRQLKEMAQLDGWVRDGSATTVEALCDFDGAAEESMTLEET